MSRLGVYHGEWREDWTDWFWMSNWAVVQRATEPQMNPCWRACEPPEPTQGKWSLFICCLIQQSSMHWEYSVQLFVCQVIHGDVRLLAVTVPARDVWPAVQATEEFFSHGWIPPQYWLYIDLRQDLRHCLHVDLSQDLRETLPMSRFEEGPETSPICWLRQDLRHHLCADLRQDLKHCLCVDLRQDLRHYLYIDLRKYLRHHLYVDWGTTSDTAFMLVWGRTWGTTYM